LDGQRSFAETSYEPVDFGDGTKVKPFSSIPFKKLILRLKRIDSFAGVREKLDPD
jgi:hypothetical protein